MLNKHIAIICLLIAFTCNYCSRSADINYKSPAGYNLTSPFLIKLPVELDEISGVAFYTKDTSLFAIGDEFGWLYKIPLTPNKPIRKWKFSNEGDYEDLAMVDKVFYVLQSDGNITSFSFDDSNKIAKQDIPFESKGNEFEILYYDASHFSLTMICKDCESDRKKALTVFHYDLLKGHFSDTASIDVKVIASMIGQSKIKFKPSAAAIHPVTHEIYIVSSVNKLLVVADSNGVAKETYPIDPKLFKQPEGITFSPTGDMIISNESADKGAANLLFFKYNKKPTP
jgi:hypothetical protein